MAIGEGVNTLHQKNEFEVEIDRINNVLGFSKVGPFKMTIGESKYKPGAAKIPYKDASHGEYENITFERAASSDQSIAEWAKECLNAITNSAADDYKRNGTVKQLGRDGRVIVQYEFFDAYIVEYEPAEFDGDSEDYMMEKFTLSVHYWDRLVQDQ